MAVMLATLLQQYMQTRGIGSKRLADLVNEQFDLHLHRNTIENWRTGAVKQVRNWRPLVAIATVLHLSATQTDNLLLAAGHSTLLQLCLFNSEKDANFLDYWRSQAPETPDMASPMSASCEEADTPLVVLKLAADTCFTMQGVGTFGIGRSDPAQNWFPTVTLDPHEGIEMGVSRKHGAIQITKHGVFIEDYGSRNGTKCNGHTLTPHCPHLLADGDKLLLSRLLVSVQIK